MRTEGFASILVVGFIFSLIFFLAVSVLLPQAQAKKVTWQQTVQAAKDLGFSPSYLNWLIEWHYLGRPHKMIDGKPYPKHLIKKWSYDLKRLDEKLGLR